MRYIILLHFLLLSFCSALQAQCYENRHSTNWHDGWISCEVAPNPNTARDDAHWILYDLKGVFELNRTHIWNYNDVENLGNGMREMAIDYSIDGTNWTTLGIFTIDQASGSSIYEGVAGPDFGGIEAAYILLTGLSNYGGTCYGLSEIRFEAEAVFVAVEDITTKPGCMEIQIFPNPLKTDARAYVRSNCSNEAIGFEVVNMIGQKVIDGELINGTSEQQTINLSKKQLPAGEYMLTVIQGKERSTKKFIVL